ncbi:MAG: hypothetical protein ILP19_00465, partial [Oscillospiraceae bacterium]|nr:hypothetical protein [Oscillospiraceae bacterium]
MQIIPYLEYSLYQMFFIFLFWSVIGWMIEVVDMTYETGAYQNRGFLNGPICPIYGFGVLMMLVLFRPFKDTFLILFLVSTVLCTSFEFFMGWLMETAFHMRWWDYSHMKFNIKGYICLRNSLFFGSGCVVVYHWAEPLLERGIAAIPVRVGFAVICIIMTLITIDTVSSVSQVIKLGKRIKRLDEISSRMLAVSQKTGMRLADGTLKVKSGIYKVKDTADSAVEKAQDLTDSAREKAIGLRDRAVGKAIDLKDSAVERAADLADTYRSNFEQLRAENDRLLEDTTTESLIRAFHRTISRNYSRGLR